MQVGAALQGGGFGGRRRSWLPWGWIPRQGVGKTPVFWSAAGKQNFVGGRANHRDDWKNRGFVEMAERSGDPACQRQADLSKVPHSLNTQSVAIDLSPLGRGGAEFPRMEKFQLSRAIPWILTLKQINHIFPASLGRRIQPRGFPQTGDSFMTWPPGRLNCPDKIQYS